jgi:putative DNA primase/helicase
MHKGLDKDAIRAASRLEDVIPALTGQLPLSRNGSRELMARCSWHGDGEDRHPSLRINVEKQQWFCDVCKVGGDVIEYVIRHQQTDFKSALAWLAHRTGTDNSDSMAQLPRIVATFDYRALDGRLLYQSVRKEPGPNGKKKTFVQRRPGGKGGWIWDMNGVELVPYRLPDLQGKEAVFIVEGERKADRLWELQLPATCNAGGAGKWKPEHAARLYAVGVRRVAILGDNDQPGRDHVEQVARSCHAAGLTVKIVVLTDLPLKGDVIAWLDAGHARDELVTLARETAEWTPPPAPLEPTATTSPEPKSTGKAANKKALAGRALQLEESEPWSTPVDGEQLLNETAAVIKQYVVLSDAQADTGALWTGAAHAIDGLTLIPMLLLSSPTPECGKTTTATCFSGLVPRPVWVANLTPAVLFRILDKYQPTLIADEVDSWLNDEKSELRGIFNAGHWRNGAVIPRCVGDSHEVRLFNVFGAKLLAMIGWPPMTMRSRSIAIRLRKKTRAEAVDHLRDERVQEDFAELRRRWSRWALDHLDAIRAADPEMPAGLPVNRASDNWRPLLAIADLAGGTWPDRARAAALALSGVRVAEDEPEGVLLLGDIQTAFREAGDPTYLSSEEIIADLKAMPDRPWADWNKGRGITPAQLAKRLRDFGSGPLGLRTRETRLTPTKTAKRWHRDDFADAWARFVVETPADLTVEPQHPQQANEIALKVQFSEPQHEPSVAGSRKAISSMSTESVADVAGSHPDPEAELKVQAESLGRLPSKEVLDL